MNELLTLREIAVRLNVKYSTLTGAWAQRPDFPSPREIRRLGNGQPVRVFDFHEVENWIDLHRAATPKPRATHAAPEGYAGLAEIARGLGVSVSSLRYAATLPDAPRPVRHGRVAFFYVEALVAFYESRKQDAAANEALPKPELNTAPIVDWSPDTSLIERGTPKE